MTNPGFPNPQYRYSLPSSPLRSQQWAGGKMVPVVSAQPKPSEGDRLYNYLAPSQAVTLFLAGLASSFALKWFCRGLTLPRLEKLMAKQKTKRQSPLENIAQKADETEEQTGAYATEGLAAVVMFAIQHPGKVQENLKSYLAATTLGYFLASVVDGLQEIWIRREETQIRADLLSRLTAYFRQSIQIKTASDNQLRETTKNRILEMLQQYKVPHPEEFLTPTAPAVQFSTNRYPYEPVNFAQPQKPFWPAKAAFQGQHFNAQHRFGQETQQRLSELASPNKHSLLALKSAMYGLGVAFGGLMQFMLWLVKETSKAPDLKTGLQHTTKKFYKIYNVSNMEALFLHGEAPVLWTVVALTAAAKLGKTLIDGYREIEVTRYNAKTELGFQKHIWLEQDPSLHRIAEEETLEDALNHLKEALPYEHNNRKALADRIQIILSNVGRNSPPKYFQMIPPVNLVASRG